MYFVWVLDFPLLLDLYDGISEHNNILRKKKPSFVGFNKEIAKNFVPDRSKIKQLYQ